ncbi:MAG: class I SAM-dependent methyltransferase, partial [Proteobacteria bacterium]|nr:class I SAM-dependent methyltransferase [Pseudomonadota bacterium]
MAAKKKLKPRQTGAGQDHFGFQPVAEGDRQARVNTVFDSVAAKYDLMNDAMSGGLHRLWKAHLINRLRPGKGMRLLDLAGGTGDIAFRFLDRGGGPVTVVDSNDDMLARGRERAMDKGILGAITWLTGDAENLPVADASQDAYTT